MFEPTRSAPSVSVLLPVRNGERYLRLAIDSISAQTLRDFELVVVDDGSTDGTPQILESIADPRMQLIRTATSVGIASSLNVGLASTRGKLIARMDADDIAHPDRLRQQVAYLNRHETVAAVGSGFTLIDEHGQYLGTELRPSDPAAVGWELYFANQLAHPSVMYRRAVVVAAGGYATDLLHAEDYDLFARLSKTVQLANMDRSLLAYRLHSQQISAENKGLQDANSDRIRTTMLTDLLGDSISAQDLAGWNAAARGQFPITPAEASALRTLIERLSTAYIARHNLVGPEATLIRTMAQARLAGLGEQHEPQPLEPFRLGVRPLALDDPRAVVFFHHPDWHADAWREVVTSYALSFEPQQDVTLVLCADPSQEADLAEIDQRIESALIASSLDPDHTPDMLIVPDALDEHRLARLYAAADWVVPAGDPRQVERAALVGIPVHEDLSPGGWQNAYRRSTVALATNAGPPADQRVSFCIITGGTRPDVVDQVVRSIHVQNIPEYEVIIAGRHHPAAEYVYVPEEEAALTGRLGCMRNAAVARAQYENIMIMDDDILLTSNWYDSFRAAGAHFDILTGQVRLPDGTRYWDHATIGGPRGHQILGPTEHDAFVYMTGGGGWVMKDYVAHTVQWDSNLPFYNGEDVDFTRRCQAHGLMIGHNPRMVVYHAAPKYTGIGRVIGVRTLWASHADAHDVLAGHSAATLVAVTNQYLAAGLLAEAADALHLATDRFPDQPQWPDGLRQLEAAFGGPLPDNQWFCTGDPAYTTLVRRLSTWAPVAKAA